MRAEIVFVKAPTDLIDSIRDSCLFKSTSLGSLRPTIKRIRFNAVHLAFSPDPSSGLLKLLVTDPFQSCR